MLKTHKLLFDVTALSNQSLTGVSVSVINILNEIAKIESHYPEICVVPCLPANRIKYFKRVKGRLPPDLACRLIVQWPWSQWFYQLYHGPDSKIGRWVSLSQIKKTVMIHDLQPFESDIWRSSERSENMQQALKKTLNQKLQAIFVPSVFTKNEILKYFSADKFASAAAANIHPIYHGYQHMIASRSVTEALPELGQSNFLLCMGTVENRKNQLGLARAFNQISNNLPGVNLVVAGGLGENGEQIKNEILSYKNSRIHFLGAVSISVKNWLYDNCSGVVYPSFYEGFGLPLVEAMVSQKPILTSEFGAMREITSLLDTGLATNNNSALFYVDPRDVNSIAEGLKSIYEWTTQNKNTQVDWTKELSRFSWRKSAEMHMQYWSKCLK